ncbi:MULTISPECIES: response regulator transcription factor [Hymenobacter]|uniref:Response regulator transcription factor n=1 Tax=Hymenobacter armeniacus TaxID=2771358 RepID=A0ABR8JZ20_9BACT|nr:MULTISPECIES: response regulator transcription factor [Hymenobacter]MBD2724128.1 response regulator transcription factor [Hymenobacter armeniacus]MBJ6110120.1 response regulator transcription factor [Hymenobacter sp. BT523]
MNILLVEDDPRLSALIRRGLEEEQLTVRVAPDGREGEQLALSHPFDLIILDVLLPERSGLEVLAAIRHHDPDVPVLMLTALGTTTDKLQGFGGGADDYLVKPFDFAELVARVRALTRRASPTPKGSRLTFADLVLDVPSRTVTRAGQALRLTAREFNLLELLLRHPGRVLSRSEIAEHGWDEAFDAGSNVIDVYVSYLRKKVDHGFDQKLIHTVTGAGYVLRQE